MRAFAREGRRLNVDPALVELFEGDLRNPDQVDRAVRGCQAVFHAGALYSLSSPADELRAVNVDGTRHVLEAALSHPHRGEDPLDCASVSVTGDHTPVPVGPGRATLRPAEAQGRRT